MSSGKKKTEHLESVKVSTVTSFEFEKNIKRI